ncbi:MAG: TIGR02594 family protein [Hyphomicrobiaceae bacterium]
MQQPDWLDWAWRELGVVEVPGRGNNSRIVEMFQTVGHSSVRDDEVAWCAAFVGACLERSGRASTRSLGARSYLSWGGSIEATRLGAIAVLSRGSDPALGHVGFVVGETDAQVFLLGGNQSNGVNVTAFEKSRVLSYRWASESGSTSEAVGPDAVAEERTPVAADLFVSALRHVLEMEGGYSDDPYDPGGPTNKGITLSVYARWIGESISPESRSRLVARLKRIPDAMVREIYRTRYWEPADCARMPTPLALMHFDAAVNHGVAGAIRMLQQAVGADVDGEIGPQTRARIATTQLVEALAKYAEARRDRYRALKHFWRFGRGWLRRVDVTLARSGELLNVPSAPEVTVTGTHPESNASESDVNIIKRGPSNMTNETSEGIPAAKWWGESMTIWGVIVTAAATVLPVVGPLLGLDITGEMVRQIGQQLTEVIQALGGVIGTLVAIYGRMRATQPITRKLVAVKL